MKDAEVMKADEEEELVAAVLWRRLNATGVDAMRLWRGRENWRMEGSAVFLEEGRIAELAYQVTCDAAWRTRWGEVKGHLGGRAIDVEVGVEERGRWMWSGREVPEVAGCVDLDLNFSPATNLITFRRMQLRVGERADVAVAWLKVPEFELRCLPQTIERIEARAYDYAAPTVGYAGRLKVDENECVLEYPGLWVAEKVEVFSRR